MLYHLIRNSVIPSFGILPRWLHAQRMKRSSYRTRPVHILLYEGYAPDSIYIDVIKFIYIPWFLLFYTSTSDFKITSVDYCKRLVSDLQTYRIIPSKPTDIPTIDMNIYTYVYLLFFRLKSDSKDIVPGYPPKLQDQLDEEIQKVNQACLADTPSTDVMVLTYSLGSYMYIHSFDSLHDDIRSRIRYEGFIGHPFMLSDAYVPIETTKKPGIQRQYLRSRYDLFDHHISNAPHPLVGNPESVVLDGTVNYVLSRISRLLPHLLMWASPSVWHTIMQNFSDHE